MGDDELRARVVARSEISPSTGDGKFFLLTRRGGRKNVSLFEGGNDTVCSTAMGVEQSQLSTGDRNELLDGPTKVVPEPPSVLMTGVDNRSKTHFSTGGEEHYVFIFTHGGCKCKR